MSLIKNMLFGAATILEVYPREPIKSKKLNRSNYSDGNGLWHDWEKITADMKKVFAIESKKLTEE